MRVAVISQSILTSSDHHIKAGSWHVHPNGYLIVERAGEVVA